MARDTPTSAMVHHPMGQNFAQQQVGLFHAHLANMFLPNNVSGVETQQVAMFAKGYGASDFAQVGSRINIHKTCSRCLHTALLNNCIVPKPYLATFPINMPKTDNLAYVEQLAMLPSEIVV